MMFSLVAVTLVKRHIPGTAAERGVAPASGDAYLVEDVAAKQDE